MIDEIFDTGVLSYKNGELNISPHTDIGVGADIQRKSLKIPRYCMLFWGQHNKKTNKRHWFISSHKKLEDVEFTVRHSELGKGTSIGVLLDGQPISMKTRVISNGNKNDRFIYQSYLDIEWEKPLYKLSYTDHDNQIVREDYLSLHKVEDRIIDLYNEKYQGFKIKIIPEKRFLNFDITMKIYSNYKGCFSPRPIFHYHRSNSSKMVKEVEEYVAEDYDF